MDTVVAMVADGISHEQILSAFPDLTGDDIGEALRCAAEAVREREIPLVTLAACGKKPTGHVILSEAKDLLICFQQDAADASLRSA